MSVYESRYQRKFAVLQQYVASNGTDHLPRSLVVDGVEIGKWVAYLKSRYPTGRLPLNWVSDLEGLRGWSWKAKPRGPRPRAERNAEVFVRRGSGSTLEQIAREFGISKQRVHQILQRKEAPPA